LEYFFPVLVHCITENLATVLCSRKGTFADWFPDLRESVEWVGDKFPIVSTFCHNKISKLGRGIKAFEQHFLKNESINTLECIYLGIKSNYSILSST
jgi:hypothetical protein